MKINLRKYFLFRWKDCLLIPGHPYQDPKRTTTCLFLLPSVSVIFVPKGPALVDELKSFSWVNQLSCVCGLFWWKDIYCIWTWSLILAWIVPTVSKGVLPSVKTGTACVSRPGPEAQVQLAGVSLVLLFRMLWAHYGARGDPLHGREARALPSPGLMELS